MTLRVLVTALALAAMPLAPVEATTVGEAGVAASTIRKAKAERLAKAGVLTRRDLPGWTVQRQIGTSDLEGEAALYRCMRARVPSYAARHPGRAFTKGPFEFGSEAAVLGTAERARADTDRFNSARGARCYREALRTGFTKQGASVRRVSVQLIPAEVVGAHQAFGYRYDVRAMLEGVVIRIRGVTVNARVGAVEFAVGAVRHDGRWPEPAPAQRLAAKVAKRIAAI